MIFIRKLFSFLYMLIYVVTGIVLLFLSWEILSTGIVSSFFDLVHADIANQAVISLVAVIFIITGLSAPAKVARKLRKKRVVSFQNADGEVSISLSAIEDYVRKVAGGMNEIEDVRSKVAMSKKGISIQSDVIIASGANIPEITESIQLQVKQRLQNMLGVEERINVMIHVRKIGKSDLADSSEKDTQNIPYREMD